MTNLDTDHYALLGVTPAATSADITHAFRTRLQSLQPTDERFGPLVTAYLHLRRLHHRPDEGDGRITRS